jgi:NTP pyrophosphatase (non-canonical NTP hydrolase)
MTKYEAIELMISELRKAEEKFPGWPVDPVHGAAIVAEEAGELTQAALDLYYGRGDREKMRKEAAQTAAMGLRFLFNEAIMEETGRVEQREDKGDE